MATGNQIKYVSTYFNIIPIHLVPVPVTNDCRRVMYLWRICFPENE